jgi:methylphosphotriester-DNA--protein-cysteine methyltransferase
MDLDHDACYRAIELRDARFDGRFFTAVKTTGTYCRPVCPRSSGRCSTTARQRDVRASG